MSYNHSHQSGQSEQHGQPGQSEPVWLPWDYNVEQSDLEPEHMDRNSSEDSGYQSHDYQDIMQEAADTYMDGAYATYDPYALTNHGGRSKYASYPTTYYAQSQSRTTANLDIVSPLSPSASLASWSPMDDNLAYSPGMDSYETEMMFPVVAPELLAPAPSRRHATTPSSSSSSKKTFSKDQSKKYICLFEGCKQKAFVRSDYLERHYKRVHYKATEKEQFACDYRKCPRAVDGPNAFNRKDHFRDHLRDFHREDLPKRGRGGSLSSSASADDALSRRNIDKRWWRCTKCLQRIYVDRQGWECPDCKMVCERERRLARSPASPLWQRPTPSDGSGGRLLDDHLQEQREIAQLIAVTPNETDADMQDDDLLDEKDDSAISFADDTSDSGVEIFIAGAGASDAASHLDNKANTGVVNQQSGTGFSLNLGSNTVSQQSGIGFDSKLRLNTVNHQSSSGHSSSVGSTDTYDTGANALNLDNLDSIDSDVQWSTMEPTTHSCEIEQFGITKATNGTGTLPTPDDYPSDSDHSDIESILSVAPSLASSQSSVFGGLGSIAFEELRKLFLSHEDLKLLYPLGLSKVGPDRLQRNLRLLLLRYGRDLTQEATSKAQVEAAKFVRAMSTHLAISIKEAVMNGPKPRQALSEDAGRRGLALDKYLAHLYPRLEDFSSSEEDNDVANEENNWTLQSLEGVKEFMVTAKSFLHFRQRFGKWLKLDNRSSEEDAFLKQAPVDSDQTMRKPVIRVQSAEDMSNEMRSVPLSQVDSVGPAALASRDSAIATEQASAFTWLDGAHRSINRLKSLVSDLLQPQIRPGRARVSWTCRCGKRLHLEVPAIFEAEAIQFAKEAAGSSRDSVVSTRGPDARGSSPARSNAPSSSTRDSSCDSESDDSSPAPSISQTSSTNDISSPCTPGSPPSTAPSLQGDTPTPFIPAGTKQYLLLCGNNKIRRIGLENVDVTDVHSGEEIFSRLQSAYRKLRGRRRRNPFVVPKTMHYIKFELFHLKKSKECVGHYQIDCIPTIKEILSQEYAFDLPKFAPLPIPPDLFMHAFLDPGDHMGDMAVRLLPKKLRRELRWDAGLHDADNLPMGWGFLIVEEFNWRLITLSVLGAIFLISVGALLWSVLQEDVQGGTGIGQYLIAALVVLVSASLFGHGSGCDGL